MAGVRFGCGEFAPGGEPVYVPNLPVPSNPVIIPDPPVRTITIPFIPGGGREPEPRINLPGGRGPGGGGSGGGGPTPQTPGVNPPAPGGTTGGPNVSIPGPITSGGGNGYRCIVLRTFFCQGDENKPLAQRRVVRVMRSCQSCNISPEDPSCINQTKSQCEATCTDTNNRNVDCTNREPEILIQPGTGVFKPESEITVINIGNGVVNTGTQGPNITQSEVYNNSFNFFITESVGNTTTQSTNGLYTSIFKPIVPSQIATLINRENSTGVWTEPELFGINTGLIEQGLNSSLLDAFNIIHYPGGQLVGKEPFLRAIEKHLLTGTLSEFDAQHYISLASRQRSDRKIKYTNLSNTEAAERAGLGTIAAGAVLADPDLQVSIRKRQIRRQRRLNTDIKASITVEPLDTTSKTLFLTDGGICVVTTDQSTLSVPTGDGDGYYIQIDLSQGDCTPLVTLSDFSSTYFVPPEIRFNALTLFRESPKIVLTASSLEDTHELASGDTGASALRPIYMPLDLDSLQFTSNTNPLVATYNGIYRTETDQEVIDEHTTNNGLAITRVNIDYRDPLYRYILDSSAVSLEMNDITFKSIKDSKNFKGGVRISRNIPFGLIITPVVGSKFNPFNGFSNIASFGSRVIRRLSFTSDINTTDTAPQSTQLKEINLYNNVSGALKIGLVEPDDAQNVVHRFDSSDPMYTDTFYTNSKYTTSGTTVSSYGISYLVKDVLDYIIDTYDPEDIIWFDVLRRMPLNKVGELFYDTDVGLISQLERGYRNDVRIYNMIRTEGDVTSEILAEDDKVIVKVSDRYASRN